MDYQHLYAYLNTRPLEELQKCTQNIVELTRKRTENEEKIMDSSSISNEEDVILAADKMNEVLRGHRVAQRIWTEEALLRKFDMEVVSSSERSKILSRLLLTPNVCNYITEINAKIEEELLVQCSKEMLKKSAPVSHRPLRDLETNDEMEIYRKPPKRARMYTSFDATNKVHPITSCNGRIAAIGAQKEGNNFAVGAPATASSSVISAEDARDYKFIKQSVHGKSNIIWDEALDTALLNAVIEHKSEGWPAVAAAVGHGAEQEQCRRRWYRYVEPAQKGLKVGSLDWSADEERRLRELVASHPLPPAWNKTLQCMYDRTDWTAIGAALGRAPSSCSDKWKSLEHGAMKKGAFSLAEDALIERRVKEWGDKGPGLWVKLEKEMNRQNSSIASRWERLKMRTKNT